MSGINLKAAGKTHVGKVRKGNEDTFVMDSELGLFVVLDGMGGAKAGEIASSTAREVIHEYVGMHRDHGNTKELIQAAIKTANSRVHRDAARHKERRGMGTTVVAFLRMDDDRAIIGYVGDSRAYLWRDGRMQQITRDHTVVAELLKKNMLTPAEAAIHPYRNVLSRNLGSKPKVKVDTVELKMKDGDRILICSDGLTGYASIDAIEQVLGGNDTPDNMSDDLIELALRGGGGDNVTAIVIDAGKKEVPRHTQLIRTNGAISWWRRKELFLEAARAYGLCESPVCSVLSPDEALEIVAGNLSEAIFHDLEQSSGINAWTYAENLAKGWFDQDGDYDILRDLVDILRKAADDVIQDIADKGEPFAVMLDIAVTRALIVAEMAIGGVLSDKLRAVEAELLDLRAKQTSRQDDGFGFQDQPTQPFMNRSREDPPTPEVAARLQQALSEAKAVLTGEGDHASAEILEHAHEAAVEPTGATDIEFSAIDLVTERSNDDAAVGPLLDAMERARIVHIDAVKRVGGDVSTRVTALRRVAVAHRRLMHAVANLVVENTAPISEGLHRAAARTAELRAEVGRGEARLAELERKKASRSTAKLTQHRSPS